MSDSFINNMVWPHLITELRYVNRKKLDSLRLGSNLWRVLEVIIFRKTVVFRLSQSALKLGN